jgi:outer membrane protein TolC
VALPAIDPAAIEASLATLPDRRPDLAALRFGYDAENARLRTAILSQFPNVTIGLTGSSDNSNVRNLGPTATLELPIFDHNQGQIAIERATRAQLHAEYTARLDMAVGQIGASLSEIAVARRQLDELRRTLPPLTSQALTARSAQASGDLDERTALDLILAPVTKEQEIATLEQTLADQIVAIATLTGAGLPPLIVRNDTNE